jgi:hypothetical protein
MLFKEIIAISYENHTVQIHSVGKMQLYITEAGGTYRYHGTLNDYKCFAC